MGEILGLIVGMVARLPKGEAEVVATIHRVEADPTVQAKIKDSLSGLVAVLGEIAGGL